MAFHVPEDGRITEGEIGSTPDYGNNGAFVVRSALTSGGYLYMVCSDGMKWEHVSVSLLLKKNGEFKPIRKVPSWEQMCEAKYRCWDKEDVVVQYHPAESEYVNCHEFVLHLWRPIGIILPTPDPIMVGPQDLI